MPENPPPEPENPEYEDPENCACGGTPGFENVLIEVGEEQNPISVIMYWMKCPLCLRCGPPGPTQGDAASLWNNNLTPEPIRTIVLGVPAAAIVGWMAVTRNLYNLVRQPGYPLWINLDRISKFGLMFVTIQRSMALLQMFIQALQQPNPGEYILARLQEIRDQLQQLWDSYGERKQ